MTTNRRRIRLTERRIRTNPVLSFNDWLEEYFRSDNAPASRKAADKKLAEWIADGVAVAHHAIQSWIANGSISTDVLPGSEPHPRVVGLVFDDDRGVGLVNPLVTKTSAHLTHSPFLPFTAASVQSLLLRICEILAPQLPGALPEVFGFDFAESLLEYCVGNSMDVAAVLSACDALTGYECPLFASACALVEPGRDGRLIPVRASQSKCEAFVREYGRGSLLVMSPADSLDDRARTKFDSVWSVESIVELALHIGQIPAVVARLRSASAIRPHQIGLVLSRLRFLEEQRDGDQAIYLCERIEANGHSTDVVLYDKIRIRKYHADALRHAGRYKESLEIGENLERQLRECGEVVSSEERLGHSVDTAAALFDSCDFQGALRHLEPCMDFAASDPQRFSAQKRVELFNTVARIKIMLGHADWENLFERSIGLQSQFDPVSIRRTESYLIHGLLRTDQLDAAERLIARHERESVLDEFAEGFTRFFRIELERRRGRLLPPESDEIAEWHGYTFAFALQAAARQTGRSSSQAIGLLERAENELRNACRTDHNILRLIGEAISLVRAGLASDSDGWRGASEWLRQHIVLLGPAQGRYFQPALDALDERPDADAAEHFLQLMPYL